MLNLSALANGSAMCLGSGTSYGRQVPDGAKPASASWGMFAGDPVWRIG